MSRTIFIKTGCFVLSLMVGLQPAMVAAVNLSVDGAAPPAQRPIINQAANGVPLVQIVRPSNAGVSHNKFSEYNVAAEGLILNNSKNYTSTQLGGYVHANPNLSGNSARIILNEVTGVNRSRLEGYTEVAGPGADMVVANPNGISVNGGGFLNTPHVTLTTGLPELENGALKRFQVQQGDIAIEGRGLNGTNVDQFDIITRAATLNAEFHTKELNLVLGRNRVDATTLSATPLLPDSNSSPQFALDTSALGGMYANRIHLVGTENGVGVRLAGDMAATAGELRLTIDGQLQLAGSATSAGQVDIHSFDHMELKGTVAGGQGVAIDAGSVTLSNTGEIWAGISGYEADLNLKASSFLVNDGILSATGDLQLTAGNALTLNGTAAAEKRLEVMSGDQIEVSGSMTGSEAVTIRTGSLVVSSTGKIWAGTMDKGADLALHTINSLDNEGTLASSRDLYLRGGRVTNKGSALADRSLSMEGSHLTNSGTLLSVQQLEGALGNIENSGAVISQGDLTLSGDDLVNHDLIYAGGTMALQVRRTLQNQTLNADQSGARIATLYSVGDLQISDGNQGKTALVENSSGSIESQQGGITIDAEQLLNKKAVFEKEENLLSHQTYLLQPQKVSEHTASATLQHYRDIGYTVTYVPRATRCSGEDCTPDPPYYWLDIAGKKYRERKREYTIRDIDEAVSRDSAASQILAAQNLAINALDVTNSASHMSAGGDVHISATGTIRNEGEVLRFINTKTGRYNYCYKDCGSTFHKADYTWAPLPEQRTETLKEQIYSTIQAGGTLQMVGASSMTNGKEENNALYAAGFEPTEPSSVSTTEGVIDIDLPEIDSGLFTYTVDQGHPYLIERRPEFVDFGNFINSDYLLQQLNIPEEQYQKRLGDGAYETRLVREQLQVATGRRFLEVGTTTDMAQFQVLMDNAVASSKELQLTPGIALTAEQAAALSLDIVWLVEKEVLGQTVLVPKVYLSSLTLDNLDSRGSIIQGQQAALNLAGDLVNFDRLRADSTVEVIAGNSIINSGGTIRGGQVALVAQKGDVINQRLLQHQEKGDNLAHLTQTYYGEAGQIESDGDLFLAGRDVVNKGSQIQAAGNTNIHADRNIEMSSVQETIAVEANAEWGFEKVKEVRQHQAGLNSGTLTARAGQDIHVSGGTLNTISDMALAAGGDILVSAVEEFSGHSSQIKSSGLLTRSFTEEVDEQTSLVQSRLQAGGNLTMNSALTEDGAIELSESGSVNILGSDLQAKGNLVLYGGRDVTVAASAKKSETYKKKEKSLAFVYSSTKAGGNEKKDLISSTLVAEDGSAVVLAGRDLNQVASHIGAGEDVMLQAGLIDEQGDVNILSDTSEALSFSENKRSSIGVWTGDGSLSIAKSVTKKSLQRTVTSEASTVLAEQDVLVDAGKDINIIGSSIEGTNITLTSGRDTNVLAAADESMSSKTEKEKKLGISFSSDDNGFDVFVGEEMVDDTHDETRGEVAASQIIARENMRVDADGAILQVGSDIQAGNDIILTAVDDVRILSGENTVYTNDLHKELRAGLTVTTKHNLGQARDALKGVGDSGNALTGASRTLRAIDAIDNATQPSASVHLGVSTSISKSSETQTFSRGSVLLAGNDIQMYSEKDIISRGTEASAGRDIVMSGGNVVLEAAENRFDASSEEKQFQTGITLQGSKNSTSLSFGLSGSKSAFDQEVDTVSSSQFMAGRDISVVAEKDIELTGIQADAARDINLIAEEDLRIQAAKGRTQSDFDAVNLGAEVGIGIKTSSSGASFGYYASISAGAEELERQGTQNAHTRLTAGDTLNIQTGNDTLIQGANLYADRVRTDIGGDLTISSAADTGKDKGHKWNASVTVGTGGFSGSAGYGQTRGSTNWVDEQTTIIGNSEVDIHVGDHTQLDGALITANNSNLTIDTNTLGYSDTQGKDKENSWYASIGMSGGGSGESNTGSTAGTSEKEQNKGSWSTEGTFNDRDRRQVVRATVGEGTINIRSESDNSTSMTGLNRDRDRAYEITKDDSDGFEIYASQNSINRAKNMVNTNPAENTFVQWGAAAKDYTKSAKAPVKNWQKLKVKTEEEGNPFGSATILGYAEDATNELGKWTGGISASIENNGGVFSQLPALLTGDMEYYKAWAVLKKLDGKGKESAKMVLAGYGFDEFDPTDPEQIKALAHFSDYAAINGIQNSLEEAIRNGAMQTGAMKFIQQYNPEHGFLGDLLECAWDKLSSAEKLPSGNARQTASFYQAIDDARFFLNVASHSQGAEITYRALQNVTLKRDWKFQFFGAPVHVQDLGEASKGAKVTNKGLFLNYSEKGNDTVGTVFGGNARNADELITGIFSAYQLFGDESTHSNYLCQGDFCAGDQPAIDSFRPYMINNNKIETSKIEP
ncbi:MAG: hemagglutinin repeat-containing protein [Desulforhopalus sp.]